MLFSATLVLFTACTLTGAAAQDLGVPLSWRKFNNTRPLSERISISQSGIDRMLQVLDTSTAQFNGIGYWQSGNVFSAMANHDRVAGTTTYRERVLSNLNTAFGKWADYDQFGFNDDATWWATSSIYAYRAYKDATQLSHAEAVWDHVNQFAITQAQASAGKHPLKNFNLAGTCDGKTMAGGVFWRPTADDTSVNSITTGLFAALSAYLAEATGDSKYITAAINSVNWIKNLNMRSDFIVLDTINGNDCSRSPDTWLFTYNTGKMVEALGVLGAVTGDAQWTNLMVNMVASGTKNNIWEGSDGIITEGANTAQNDDGAGFKAILLRGLHAAFERSNNNDMRILVHSYVDVQYNALLDIASSGNMYSNNWKAAFPGSFIAWGQLSALDVLVAAITAN